MNAGGSNSVSRVDFIRRFEEGSRSQTLDRTATSTLSEGGHEDSCYIDSGEATPLLRSPQSSSSSIDLVAAMEKARSSKFAYYMDKLQVESEPGLTMAQQMLANHDLKPVEPARRQWRGMSSSIHL